MCRIEYYKQFAWYLYVDYESEELGCAKQKQFSAGGAGALPIYWDKVTIQRVHIQNVERQNIERQNVERQNVDTSKRRHIKTSTTTKCRIFFY
jgi:hypothetical protein